MLASQAESELGTAQPQLGFIFFLPPILNPRWGLSYIRRRLVRVLKLCRGFILTKKGDINPKNIRDPPPWPPVAYFRFKKKSNVALGKGSKIEKTKYLEFSK